MASASTGASPHAKSPFLEAFDGKTAAAVKRLRSLLGSYEGAAEKPLRAAMHLDDIAAAGGRSLGAHAALQVVEQLKLLRIGLDAEFPGLHIEALEGDHKVKMVQVALEVRPAAAAIGRLQAGLNRLADSPTTPLPPTTPPAGRE